MICDKVSTAQNNEQILAYLEVIFLVNENLINSENNFNVGLICGLTGKLIVGNPLYKIGYGNFVKTFNKKLKYCEKVNAVKLNCAEKFIALASDYLTVFDLEREISIRQFHEHNGNITDVTWHTGSPYQLATISKEDFSLRTWDVRSHPAQTSLRRLQRLFSCVQYSPDCTFVACSGESIEIFDLNSTQNFVHIPCNSYVSEIVFNPTECLLASASDDRVVCFWDVDTGECVTQSLPFENLIHRIKFHPNGKYLICATLEKISAITWEPFQVLNQITKKQSFFENELTLWKTLDLEIQENNLFHLTTSINTFDNSILKKNTNTVLLTSLNLKEFEKEIFNNSTKDAIQNFNNEIQNETQDVFNNANVLVSSLPNSKSSLFLKNQIDLELPFVLCPSNTNSLSLTNSQNLLYNLSSPLDEAFENNVNNKLTIQNKSSSVDSFNSNVELHNNNENLQIGMKKLHLTNANNNLGKICRMRNLPYASATSSPTIEHTLSKADRNNTSFNLDVSHHDKINKKSLKQLRSKSCGLTKNAQTNLMDQKSLCTNEKIIKNNIKKSIILISSAQKSEKQLSDNNLAEISKIEELIKGSDKICGAAKRKIVELENFLNYSLNTSNNSEALIKMASKQDDLRIFSMFLRTYLEHPKSYSITLNIKFLEKVRNLFASSNNEYLLLTLELLDMVVHSFADSIRHGLAANNYSLGVDVAAEQRFERCLKCKNALLEIQMNSPFLIDRLNDNHKLTFKKILSLIEEIVKE